MALTPALIADGVIVLGVIVAWWSGWRQGAFSSVLSLLGICAGIILGTAAAPFMLGLTDQVALRFLLALGVLVGLVGLGQLTGAALGAALRNQMRARSQQRWDSLVGGFFQVIAMLLVIWLVSIPMANSLSGVIGKGTRESVILGALNRHMPAQMAMMPTRIAAMLNQSGLPPLVSPWLTHGSVQVEEPKIEVENPELIKALRPSVVHVLGDAEACSRRLMGSGFVTDTDYVITNAHVVAGTNVVALETTSGLKDAQVVYYNPDVDIAVLHSPHLGIAPLEWQETPAHSGDDAVVMGFPLSGPFTASPARIREQLTIAGPDIYASGRVERAAYTLRGTVRQGNSGGPLINPQGKVLGVIFGASLDDDETGYALTATEVRGHIGDVRALNAPVNTGKCVSK